MEISKIKLTAKRKNICDHLSFNDINDIFRYYPFRYEEYKLVHYLDFKEGQIVCFQGELIAYPTTFKYQKNRSVTRFKMLYEGNELNVSIFNRPWMNVNINENLTIIGKYEGNNKVIAYNYYTKDLNLVLGINPYYSIKEGITQNDIKKLIQFAFNNYQNELIDNLPKSLIEEHKLLEYEKAIEYIHFPKNKDDLRKAISRLKYEEFLNFYVALDILKGNNDNLIRKPKKYNNKKIEAFIKNLPYELTKDQIQTIDSILNDMKSNKPMYRLVQGEVGSGKTVVSMISLYANYLSKFQGALMAPTEILAKQHYDSYVSMFEKEGIKIALLTGNGDNKEIKKKIANGEVDIVIGTHALFSDDVIYKNLGMVIADEQHRFGVRQRKKLKDKGDNVDFILMSATPIPRTLASSIYGDMDISTIETLPVGRKGCKTVLINQNTLKDEINEIKIKLAEGKQIYVIASSIENSENYHAKSATDIYKSLIKKLKPYNVSLLHGRLTTEEKETIMNEFYENKTQVLVSTTVVEVGVNVKNATVMVIYDADRFGMSQLHQLRGRIQRGNEEGLCYLLTDNKDENVIKRLEILCQTNDGFKISYEDLKMRGPGDILGTRQSGLPAFILGNLIEDTKFIEAAKIDAKNICNNLDNNEFKVFYDKVQKEAQHNYVD